ncbi:ABC transporter permease [Candidatus Sumerlaeota bacterium]|nr:ABC transporter permease [Candidatus Sumerlaeota bacterium]
MRLSSYIFLIVREFRRNRGRTLSVLISLVIASFFLLLALGLRNGILNGVFPELEKAFPEKILLVKPRTLSLAGLRLDTEKLSSDVVQKIREVPGVAFVSPQLTLAFPTRAITRIFGNIFSTDVVVIGVEKRIIERFLAPEEEFVYSPGKPVPALTSQYFLNIYNLGLSDSLGLPKFSSRSVIGRTFQLVLGETTLGNSFSTPKSRIVECKLVGFTSDISLIGLILPLEAVEDFNAWFWGNKEIPYSALRIGVTSLEQVDSVTNALKKMNLSVSSNVEELNRLRFNLRLVLVLVFLFVLSIAVVVGLNIINITASVYRENLTDLLLFRMLGATPFQFLFLISLQRLITGIVAGLLGSTAAFGTAKLLNSAIAKTFQNIPFIPETLFRIPFYWIFLMTVLILVVNLGVGLIFYAPAFRKHPAELFMKGTQI